MSSDNLDFFDFDNSTPVAKTMSFTCEDCGLYRQCESPKTGVMGNGKKRILIINEFSNKTDDLNSDVMSGSVGSYIRRLCNKLDLDFEDDLWRINAVQCTPYKGGKYREPSDKEAACCRTQLHNTIRDLQPAAIVTLGMKALSVLIGDRIVGRIKKVKWTDFFQTCIPDQALKTWICPTYNPLFFKEERNTEDYDRMLRQSFEMALEHIGIPCPDNDIAKVKVDILHDPKEVRDRIMDFIENNEWGAFDYEANMLKSQSDDFILYCTSISNGKETFVFRNTDETNKYLRMFLKDKNCGKIAHNLSFENAVSYNAVGTLVHNWTFDTCLGAHCVHNQRSAGLKLQTYINFGNIGYDASVEDYIESSDDAFKKFGCYAKNKIMDANPEDVMYYCGLDSYFSAKLYPIQYKQLSEWDGKLNGYEFYLQGSVSLSRLHINGICFDEDLANKVDAEITEDINHLYGQLYHDFPEWNSKTTGKGLEEYIYDVLKLKNAEGTRSLEAEMLETMDHDFTRQLVEIRKLEKIRDTFLAGYFKEAVDGRIHAFFSNYGVRTFRSCVAYGTPISMAYGAESKRIEHIREGDYVVSIDAKNIPQYKKVLWAGKTGEREVLRLHYYNEWESGYIDVTPEHRIRLLDGSYVPAKELKRNDSICGYVDNGFAIYEPQHSYDLECLIKGIEYIGKICSVYDLEVEDTHNFIANKVCVHNSSRNPNMQNQSKHDEVAKKYLRKCIVPKKGCRILEADYRALEAFMAVQIYPDKTFQHFTEDPDADLHKTVSLRILGCDEEFWNNLSKSISKEIRNITKLYNFSSLFGSSGKVASEKMWPKYTKDMKAVLAKCGIKSFEQFQQRMIDVDAYVWKELFKDYGRLRQVTYDNYLKTGYIDLPTGFRCSAPITYTQAVNIIVQGSASHMKLHALNRIFEEFDRLKLKSVPALEIHDSVIVETVDSETLVVKEIVNRCMTESIYERFPWFKVQLYAEFELSDLRENGGSWHSTYDFDQVMFYHYCGLTMDANARLEWLHRYYGTMEAKSPKEELEKLEKAMFKDNHSEITRFVNGGGMDKGLLNSFLKGA